jgi:hypothetical protein
VMDNVPAVTTVTSGVPITGLAGATGSWSYYRIVVPGGAPSLTVTSNGPNGDADLIARLGAFPSLTAADAYSAHAGSIEGFSITNLPPGVWYFGVYGYAAFSGLTVTASVP